MRFATDGKAWDRLLPIFVLPYAIWTLYVHLIVLAHASFTAGGSACTILSQPFGRTPRRWFRG